MSKPEIGQIEDHFAAGKYQPCKWTGSAWAPVAAARRPVIVSGVCPRCHTYCAGDCRAH